MRPISILPGAPAAFLLAAIAGPSLAQAPAPPAQVPLVTGLVLGSVLHSPLGLSLIHI